MFLRGCYSPFSHPLRVWVIEADLAGFYAAEKDLQISPLVEQDAKSLQRLLPEIPHWVKYLDYDRAQTLNRSIIVTMDARVLQIFMLLRIRFYHSLGLLNVIVLENSGQGFSLRAAAHAYCLWLLQEGKALKLLARAAWLDIEDFLRKKIFLEVEVK
ncbi:hypothetical protein ACET3Z_029445 [Daucus carota]